MLGEMTSSGRCFSRLMLAAIAHHFIFVLFILEIGLHIVYTLDEVDFVQNLVFYIEQSYMIPVSIDKAVFVV